MMGKILLQIGRLSIILFISMSAVPACYNKIEREFFIPQLVEQALAMHDVSQSAWREINRELSTQARRVPELVRRRAEVTFPNPFGTPYDPVKAGEILESTLIQVLMDTLIDFNIRDPQVAREIFFYIRERQIDQWKACFSKIEHK